MIVACGKKESQSPASAKARAGRRRLRQGDGEKGGGLPTEALAKVGVA